MFRSIVAHDAPNDSGGSVISLSDSRMLLQEARKRFGYDSVDKMIRAVGDLTAANLATYGGHMDIVQIKQWFNLALGIDPVDHTSAFNLIDTSPFAGVNGEKLSWFTTSGRNLVKHSENTSNSERVGVETDDRETTPVKSKMLWEPSYDFLKQSITADPTGAALQIIMTMLYRNDLADLLWNGDTDSTDATLSIHDGLIKKMKDTTNFPLLNRVDSTNMTNYTGSVNFTKTEDALDELWDEVMSVENGKYANLPTFSFFAPPIFLSQYKRLLRNRGDKTLESGVRRLQDGPALQVENYNGITIYGIPYFPQDVLSAAPSNVYAWKYVEDLMIEHDRDINKQAHLFVTSQRHNCEIKGSGRPVFALYDQS